MLPSYRQMHDKIDHSIGEPAATQLDELEQRLLAEAASSQQQNDD